jgi:hypothetical protein
MLLVVAVVVVVCEGDIFRERRSVGGVVKARNNQRRGTECLHLLMSRK